MQDCARKTAFDRAGIKYVYSRGYAENTIEADKNMIDSAVKTSQQYDTILVFAGLTDYAESEGCDREHMHVGYYITPHFHYYGVVSDGEHKVVIGPSMQTRNSEQAMRELAFQCDVSPEDTADFIIGMKSIVSMPLDSILQILCTMNYVMNNEKLGLGDIIIYDAEQQNLRAALEQERAKYNFDSDLAAVQDVQNVHNTLALEQTIVNFVRRGDTEALKEWFADAPAVRGGVLAADQLRQIKNTFIVTATLVSRGAIRGGMDVDDALSLSDAYIQKCELLNNVERIINLQYHMVFDYAEQVEKLQCGKQPSKLVQDVAKYIQRHLSEPITTNDIAKAIFLSRSRLSVKFKKETGENLIDYILKEKTEEAKRLLRYTDKTAVAISAYLGFSSQSHFTRVFKKYAGILPNEYRWQYNK